METKKRLAGRFLPSRVYARWVWTVRSCLVVLPAILFLAGALTLYLSPSRFKSTVTFEYVGKRPLPDVAALMKSSNLLGRVHDSLELGKRLGVDRDTSTTILRDATEVTLTPATRMMQVDVVLTPAELARDVAAAFPKALEDYEKSLAIAEIKMRLHDAQNEVAAAEDRVAFAQKSIARLVSVRGEETGDPVSQLDVDAARAAWTHANEQLLESQALVDRLAREHFSLGTWTVTHTVAQISHLSVGPNSEDTLGIVILRSLGIGLGCALAIPYLLELAFPRRHRKSAAEPTWQDAETDLSREPAHG
jgi:hypothetical protein